MKILAFGASYSQTSINKEFATYAASKFEDANVEILDLNNYQLPLLTVELENEIGHPEVAKEFVNKLGEAELIIISLSEHNGSYTAAFKNLFDWASRVKLNMFENKKVLLLATAPGPRGGLSVLEAAEKRFPIHGAEIITSFSLPKFQNNFSKEKGILDADLRTQFEKIIEKVKDSFTVTA